MKLNRHASLLLAALQAGAVLATTACDQPSPPGRTALDTDHAIAGAVNEGLLSQVAATASDSDVKARVQFALHAEPDLTSQRIFVDVSDGIVTLSGVVDSVALRDRAKRIVHATAGVTPLVDLMVVKSTAAG